MVKYDVEKRLDTDPKLNVWRRAKSNGTAGQALVASHPTLLSEWN